MLARLRSTSTEGAWPHHSDRRWPRIRLSSPSRRRSSNRVLPCASSTGASNAPWGRVWRAISSSSGRIGGSDGIYARPTHQGSGCISTGGNASPGWG
jgi:hypothetical protein